MSSDTIYQMPDVDPARIESVYLGRARACMCGCAGDYAYTPSGRERAGVERGYAIHDNEVSERKVRSRLALLREHAAEGIDVIDGRIFSIDYGDNRRVALYLFEGKA